MDDRTREAIAMRLDTRCIKWPFITTGGERRCEECDGCISHRWFRTQRDLPGE